MNTKLRIVSLALGLGLAGVVTVTWGAESVMSLISHGEVAVRELKSSRAAYKNAEKQNKDLAAEGKQIAVDTQKHNQEVIAFKARRAALSKKYAEFTARCAAKKDKKKDNNKATAQPNQKKQYETYQEQRAHYKQCLADQKKLVAETKEVNAVPAKLNKESADLNTRSDQYNKHVKEFMTNAPKLQNTFTDKLNTDEDWLNKVRSFVASPAVQPYAKKAKCPDTKKIAKDVTQVIEQSEQYLACLKKIAGT